MYASSDSLAGSPTFTVKTVRTDDGYEASAPQVPDIQPVRAATEIEAIRELQSAITTWLLSGASPKRKR